MFIGIIQGFPDIINMISLNNRSYGTDGGALSALNTGYGIETFSECRSYNRIVSAVLGKECSHSLHLVANSDAPAALDTFG